MHAETSPVCFDAAMEACADDFDAEKCPVTRGYHGMGEWITGNPGKKEGSFAMIAAKQALVHPAQTDWRVLQRISAQEKYPATQGFHRHGRMDLR